MNNKEFERYDTTVREVQFEEVGKYEHFIKTNRFIQHLKRNSIHSPDNNTSIQQD